METTVASSVLCRLVLQLALLIAAVHGWCNLGELQQGGGSSRYDCMTCYFLVHCTGLDSIPEEHAFSSLTITCDSSTPVVSWTSRYQEVCWGYTNCSNQVYDRPNIHTHTVTIYGPPSSTVDNDANDQASHGDTMAHCIVDATYTSLSLRSCSAAS